MAMGRQIIFRVDSASFMGAGHVRRCLTLADRLAGWGFSCTFICADYEESFNQLVSVAGHALKVIGRPLSAEQNAPEGPLSLAATLQDAEATQQTIDAITDETGRRPEAIVVDHYGLSKNWHSALRHVVDRIIVIDDLGRNEFDCDALVVVAPETQKNYSQLVPVDCRCLLGPRFAMLRDEFALAVQSKASRSLLHDGSIGRILISMGATDSQNLSSLAVRTIRAVLGHLVEIDVILSSLAPSLGAVKLLADSDPKLTCHVDSSDMARMMDQADLAIGAGGTTAWERAAMGLPTLLTVVADNQQATADALADLGAAIVIDGGPDFVVELRDTLKFLSGRPGFLRMMSNAASALVDGRGASRVAAAIVPPVIKLRRAADQDSQMIWEWRNHDSVRSTAIDPSPIAWGAHDAWLKLRLTDLSGALLIAEDRGNPSGVLRFDIDAKQGDEALVSIYLAPNQAGRGLGQAILAACELWLRANLPNIRTLRAQVRPENTASLALFRAASYQPHLLSFIRELPL